MPMPEPLRQCHRTLNADMSAVSPFILTMRTPAYAHTGMSPQNVDHLRRQTGKPGSVSGGHQSLFYVALPGFVIANAPLSLFTRQSQSPGHIADALSTVVLLVV